ncbi:MAG: 3-hydroxybutyryl-CoA dehydrogenase [Chloroflexi bacterium]|nr:3-hydroxybutyryl-CoA dehydrogenase [Chloroflexota bacterium]
MEVKTICVMGAGQLGSGIAQVAIQSGFRAILRDINHVLVEKGANGIREHLDRQVERAQMEEVTAKEVWSRLTLTTDMSKAREADVLIEAIPESIELKKRVYAELDSICPPNTIFASNTSSIPITKLASATKRPDRVIGMHFMHPVPVIKLLELVRGYLTSDETFHTIRRLGKAMGRAPIRVSKDYAGFGNKHIQMHPQASEGTDYNALLWALMQGKTTVAEIEKRTMGMGMEGMSPLAWMDFVGLDTLLNIQLINFEEYGDPRLYPCPLLRRMVEAGHLGQKTGIGFYDYSELPRQATKFSSHFLRFIAPEPEEV